MSGMRVIPCIQRCWSGIRTSQTASLPLCRIHHSAVMQSFVPREPVLRHLMASSSQPSDSLHSDSGQPTLPQLDTPNYDRELEFKGLETDFPCLSRIPTAGPEPEYGKIVSGYKTYDYQQPFKMKYNDCILPKLSIAYETWGEPNSDKSNAVLIFTGLSSSSHARSHRDNPADGWWEKFVGPGCAIDTNEFFVICCNHIGGCYGTTGPSSISPVTGQSYGTTFPVVSVEDMVRSQFLLMDHLGVDKLYAAVGSSLGGMCSVMAAAFFPDRVGRVISISACAQTYATSIALRYLQRRAIMTDPNWQRGHYYNKSYPRMGMKLAREIATITYRSGPEWKERFGRDLINPNDSPSLCPSFMIESYIEYQGEAFCNKYDPNSLLYISKAMDMFDMGEGFSSLEEGLSRVKCPVMVLGAQTDILIPIWQQREMVQHLRNSGNESVSFYELNSIFGHDTFLLDLNNVGGAIKGQLETNLAENGYVRKKPSWMTQEQTES